MDLEFLMRRTPKWRVAAQQVLPDDLPFVTGTIGLLVTMRRVMDDPAKNGNV